MIHLSAWFCLWCLAGVFGDTDEVKSVMEGDSVTLNSGLTEIINDILIRWRFGNKSILIAEIDVLADTIKVFDVLDGRFRDKLKLNKTTGSLTITDTTAEHTGRYKLQTNRESKNFTLTVYARLAVPVISKACSSSTSCSVVCSVVNVSHVTLSWLKGNSLLSSISVSDLSISLSLPLEVEDQDTNNYSCVLNNSITHQTTHLNISDLCQTCPGIQCCDSVEPVIRLVVTVLMGVAAAAAVVLLVNDIRSTRGLQQTQSS